MVKELLRNSCRTLVKYLEEAFLRSWAQRHPATNAKVSKLFCQILRLYCHLPKHPFSAELIRIAAKYKPSGTKVQTVVRGLIRNLDLSETIESNIYYYGCFEPYSTKVVLNIVKKNMIVFDIGANIGYYTLLLSSLVGKNGRAYAFEPMSEAMARLKEHCKINNAKNVILEKKVVAENTEPKQPVSFTCNYPLLGESKAPNTEFVDFISIDDYVSKHNISSVDFMKIDVDGYEYKVVSGAKNTIKRFKPIILVELGRYTLESVGDSLEELLKLLYSLGYSFYSEKNLRRFSSLDSLLDAVPEGARYSTINVLCKPDYISNDGGF